MRNTELYEYSLKGHPRGTGRDIITPDRRPENRKKPLILMRPGIEVVHDKEYRGTPFFQQDMLFTELGGIQESDVLSVLQVLQDIKSGIKTGSGAEIKNNEPSFRKMLNLFDDIYETMYDAAEQQPEYKYLALELYYLTMNKDKVLRKMWDIIENYENPAMSQYVGNKFYELNNDIENMLFVLKDLLRFVNVGRQMGDAGMGAVTYTPKDSADEKRAKELILLIKNLTDDAKKSVANIQNQIKSFQNKYYTPTLRSLSGAQNDLLIIRSKIDAIYGVFGDKINAIEKEASKFADPLKKTIIDLVDKFNMDLVLGNVPYNPQTGVGAGKNHGPMRLLRSMRILINDYDTYYQRIQDYLTLSYGEIAWYEFNKILSSINILGWTPASKALMNQQAWDTAAAMKSGAKTGSMQSLIEEEKSPAPEQENMLWTYLKWGFFGLVGYKVVKLGVTAYVAYKRR